MNRVEIVRDLYTAFSSRDQKRLRQILHPEIEWVQMEGFPNGGSHVGAESVLNGVFTRFRSEWASWNATVDEYLDAGDAVIALGYYSGVHQRTGKAMRAPFAHLYVIRERQIVRFVQYTDTLKVAEAAE